MQTQRTILWVVFSMSLLFLWDAWQRHTGQPSLLGNNNPAPTATGSATPVPGAPATVTTPPAATTASAPPASGSTPTSAAAPAVAVAPVTGKLITLKNDVLQLEIDPVGGVIRRSELLAHKETTDKSKNITLLDNKAGAIFWAETGFVGAANQAFPNQTTTYTVEDGPRELGSADKVAIKLTAESAGLKVVKTITLNKNSYEVLVSHDVTNTSTDNLTPQLFLQLTRDGHKPAGIGGPADTFGATTYTGPVVYTDKSKFQKVEFADIEKNKANHEKQATDGWFGMIQHYFVTVWIPTDKANRDYLIRKVANNLYAFSATQPLAALAPGASARVESRLFIGPQDQNLLARVAPGLDLSVDYGIFTVIAKPLYWLLEFCYSVVKNWGWAIIMLTAIVKLAFFPLQNFAYKSMARMKLLAPKMKALQEKYGNDRMKLNQAMMEMYKTEKVNPMGSCLPVLLQIPVFISLYWVLLASVEVRNAPWILWIKDLALPDPWFVLPLILAATSYLQVKMSPPPPDPMQAKLMTMMPLVFSIMFFFFPAGLVLYWLANNCFSIAQQWYINRSIEKAGLNSKAA